MHWGYRRMATSIQVPPATHVGNVKTYFSGHYQLHRFNIQAIVGHLGQFLFIAVAAHGSQLDVNAFNQTSLYTLLMNLPFRYFLLGDNAYKSSEYDQH